jgi:hypothetical protein
VEVKWWQVGFNLAAFATLIELVHRSNPPDVEEAETSVTTYIFGCGDRI